MADSVDHAADVESRILQLRIDASRNASKISNLLPIGVCANCEEAFDKGDPRIFCDAECAEDFEKRQRG